MLPSSSSSPPPPSTPSPSPPTPQPSHGVEPTQALNALSNLSSSDESLRSEAEKVYDRIKHHPDPISARIGELLHSSPNPSTRNLSALSLLNLINRNLWSHLDTIHKRDLQNSFLTSLRNESYLLVLRHVSLAIAALVVQTKNQWSQIHLFMFQSLISDQSRLRHFAVFSLFAELAPKIGPSLSFHEDELHEAANKYLDWESEEDPQIHCAAARALISLIMYVSKEEDNKNKYKEVPVNIMAMIRVQLIGPKHYEYVNQVLSEMVVLAREKTGMLENDFELLFGVMDFNHLIDEEEGEEGGGGEEVEVEVDGEEGRGR